MAAGRVAECLSEIGLHRLDNPWISGSRGVVVHVDRSMQHGPEVGGRLLDGTYRDRDRDGFCVTWHHGHREGRQGIVLGKLL